MKKRDVVLRIALLGIVAVVLGTAAAMSGSEVGMVRMTTVEEGIAGEAPRALKLPGEMTEEEREILGLVTKARNEGSLTSVRRDDEVPYGCERPLVYFMGNAHWVLIDDWVWRFPLNVGSSDPYFWQCWIAGYNTEYEGIDTIFAPDSVINPTPPELVPLPGSVLYWSDSTLRVWWGLYRGESLLGYCEGNVDECGRGFYYVYDDEFTCEESLVVTLWDERNGSSLLFGYELFEDVPWDEYDVCEE